MKHLLYLVFLLFFCFGFAQDGDIPKKYTLDISQFYGSILLHNPDISHLITNHPGGVIIGFNRKRFGHEDWEAQVSFRCGVSGRKLP